jgi:hypothetical protein
MKRLVAKTFRWLRLIEFDLLSRESETYPMEDQVVPGELVFVVDEGIENGRVSNAREGVGPLSLSPSILSADRGGPSLWTGSCARP